MTRQSRENPAKGLAFSSGFAKILGREEPITELSINLVHSGYDYDSLHTHEQVALAGASTPAGFPVEERDGGVYHEGVPFVLFASKPARYYVLWYKIHPVALWPLASEAAPGSVVEVNLPERLLNL